MKSEIKLLEHQRKTIKYLEQECVNQKGLLLWHYMGTGKTLTGLFWLNHIIKNYSDRYFIFCPPLIASSWITNSKKMNFSLNYSRILNYLDLRIMIEKKDPKIKNSFIVFDEAQYLIDIIKQLNKTNNNYMEVNNYLRQCNKLLLLTGTPFEKNEMNLAYYLNLCNQHSNIPISQQKWTEKFSDETIFEENRKNPIYFNYLRPFFMKYGSSFLSEISNILSFFPFFRYVSIKTIVKKVWIYPLLNYLYQPINNLVTQNIFEHLKQKTINSINLNSNWLLTLQRLLGRSMTYEKIIQFLTQNFSFDINNKKESVDSLINNFSLNNWLDNYKNLPSILKEKLIFSLAALGGVIIWYLIHYFWEILYDYVDYDYNDLESLKYLNIDDQKVLKEIKRYVSYYKYDEQDSNYPQIEPERETLRSILSLEAMIVTIEFYFGKIDNQLLSFITNRSIQDLEVNNNLILSKDGFKSYGRVISNLPEFIRQLVTFKNNFKIDQKTGNITLINFSNEEIIEQSSNKFKQLAQYLIDLESSPKTKKISLRKLNNKEISDSNKKLKSLKNNESIPKIIIYSDYLYQGAYLLSGYLTARKIKHLYLNQQLTSKNQISILELFNDKSSEYNILILDKDSKEGINLLNIEQLHFLEPPINTSNQLQVIGRTIRFQSHKQLPKNRRTIKIFNHISSIFKNQNKKKSFFEHLKNLNFYEIFFGNLISSYNQLKDQSQINQIIHTLKNKHFKDKIQSTFSTYLDEFLEINLKHTIQNQEIYGTLPNKNKKNKKNKKSIDDSNKYKVVLSIDEQLEDLNIIRSNRYQTYSQLMEDNSILSKNFKIIPEYNCKKNKSFKIINTL